jgi:hypothetical protein
VLENETPLVQPSCYSIDQSRPVYSQAPAHPRKSPYSTELSLQPQLPADTEASLAKTSRTSQLTYKLRSNVRCFLFYTTMPSIVSTQQWITDAHSNKSFPDALEMDGKSNTTPWSRIQTSY